MKASTLMKKAINFFDESHLGEIKGIRTDYWHYTKRGSIDKMQFTISYIPQRNQDISEYVVIVIDGNSRSMRPANLNDYTNF